MKKTKEIKEENEILKINSLKEAEEFKSLANGRKFCKRGQRLVDICEEEVSKYEFKRDAGFFARIFKSHKLKKREKYLALECRNSSIVRAFAIDYINKCQTEEKTVELEETIKFVKNEIITRVEEFEKTNS